jgi:hypothetical protein
MDSRLEKQHGPLMAASQLASTPPHCRLHGMINGMSIGDWQTNFTVRATF